jgi:hypothetical protein
MADYVFDPLCPTQFYTYGSGSGTGCTAPTSEAATVTTDETCDRWCGKWSTKEAALNSLFNLYKKKTGKILRWYINFEGYLEWFEIGEREGIEYFFNTDGRITSFNVSEDSSSIKNDITGTYGEGDSSGFVQITDAASIAKYGLMIEDSITNSCMDETEMTAYLQYLLDMKCVPIYTASIELNGFYLIEPGKQIMFPDDIHYPTTVWTVVDWKFNDAGATPSTSLNLTTDSSVISLPNEFEVIQSTAQDEVNKSLPEAAVVTEVIDDEHLLVTRESDGVKVIVRSLATSD